jgi:hypothetical protein
VEGETMVEWTGMGDPPPPSRPGRWARTCASRAAAGPERKWWRKYETLGFPGQCLRFYSYGGICRLVWILGRATNSNWAEIIWPVQFFFGPVRNGRNPPNFGPFGPNPKSLGRHTRTRGRRSAVEERREVAARTCRLQLQRHPWFRGRHEDEDDQRGNDGGLDWALHLRRRDEYTAAAAR